ncbi:MAG: hypothetical protein VKL42_08945 [Snowella sp.]|nr:hypothetical protein [Snowella sp.]
MMSYPLERPINLDDSVAMSFEYLREKIRDEGWVGKAILQITDDVRAFLDAPSDWLFSLPPMQAIADTPPLAFLIDMISELEDIAPTCCLLFLETSYGINKAYNSEKYQGQLTATGQRLLSSARLRSSDEAIYLSGVESLNSLSALSTHFMNISGTLDDYSPSNVIESLEAKAISAIEDKIAEITAIAEGLGEDVTQAVKRQLRDLKRVLDGALNQNKENVRELYTPRFVSSLVPVTPGTPTVAGGVGFIFDMANWLLTNFVLKATPIAVPVEALCYTTTSIVVKYMNGLGADACRFLSGGILRGVGSSLPTLIAPTGLFAGCWGFLQAFAPYIIFVAILVIALMKYRKVVGEYLHVIGQSGPAIAYGSAKLYDTSREEMLSSLKSLAKKMTENSTVGFTSLMGFAFDDKDEISMAINLINDEQIYGKEAMNLAVVPYLSIIQDGILAHL